MIIFSDRRRLDPALSAGNRPLLVILIKAGKVSVDLGDLG